MYMIPLLKKKDRMEEQKRASSREPTEKPTNEIVQAADVDSDEEVTAEHPGIGKVCLVPPAAKNITLNVPCGCPLAYFSSSGCACAVNLLTSPVDQRTPRVRHLRTCKH